MKRIIYNGSLSPSAFYGAIEQGDQLVCPVCNADLVVALDGNAGAKYKCHPGVFCPTSREHVQILTEVRRPDESYWGKFKK